ncbi:MAG: HPr(Ser) kinase/phosphatase, partial [Rhodothermia bacterium]|nr:HPr(Ser) kinase/phosphatase [Rhodothermia bacterium]
MPHQPIAYKKESITVDFLAEQLRKSVGLDIESVNDVSGADRQVTESNLHRPGLALAGYIDLFTHQRVQILGNTENLYLRHLSQRERVKAFRNLVRFPVPCIFLTEDNKLYKSLVNMASKEGIPIFRTSMPSTEFMSVLRDFLTDQFALQQSVHASLVDVYGIGLLLVGKPGIGKSEVALDLVERGHRLVADDVVIVTKKEENLLMGSGTALVQHFMEIRGLGLIDVRAMFGVRAIRFQKRV